MAIPEHILWKLHLSQTTNEFIGNESHLKMIFVMVAIREESFSEKIRRKEGKRERKERKEHV